MHEFSMKLVGTQAGIFGKAIRGLRVQFKGPGEPTIEIFRTPEDAFMATSAVPTHEQTLKNLLAAFNGESNASARYAAFAIKADEEGYHKVGSLFRAASRAEQIHAANHSQVIKKLGGTPVATIEAAAVKTTADNLKVAIAGERYEVDVMYPGFITEAEAQKSTAARRTFKYAFEVEKAHAVLFSQALEHLEHCEDKSCQKLSNKATYYVCPECGFTADKAEFDRCPVCGHAKEKFELVS
jgi:rubrerythrin